MKQEKHQVSLKRPDGWYSADNEMVTVFAPLIGPYAFSVYHLLKQRSFLAEGERGISHLGISEALTMSKDSVGNALATLKQFYLLEELPPVSTNRPPRYEVIHAKDALATHPEIRTWLESKHCKKPQTSILKSGRGKQAKDVPQFPQSHPEIRTMVRTKRILKSGRTAGDIQDASGRYSGRTHPEIRIPNKEEVLEVSRQEQDSTPLPPEGGGYSLREEQGFETKNETAVADGVVWVGAKVAAAVGVPVEARGDSGIGDDHDSPVGHVAPAEPKAEATGGHRPRLAADGLTPVRDTLVGMLRDLRANDPEAEQSPGSMATHFLQFLHDAFDTVPTASGYAAARGPNWEDPYEAWQRCFDHVSYGGTEMDGDRLVVVLETPRPKDLAAGLVKYQAKVKLAMKKAFGREVQLVPRLEAA